MDSSNIKKVVVLGTGVLGGQIAWHCAYKGKHVVAYNRREESLEKARAAHDKLAQIYMDDVGASAEHIAATRSRLSYLSDLQIAVSDVDLVIESLPEIPAIKSEYYEKMANYLPSHTIVVTNSSTFLPRDFAESTGRPDKYCSLHFANLIWIANLIEIMANPKTTTETLTAVTRFAIEIGQVPIPLHKEQNGYVLNSWLPIMLNAALSLVTNGVSTPEDVDRSYMIVNRGCTAGPFGILDTIGMRTFYELLNHWGPLQKDPQMIKNAKYLKQNFIDRGLYGLENDEGFYTYPNPGYAAPDFIAPPSMDDVPSIVKRATLG